MRFLKKLAPFFAIAVGAASPFCIAACSGDDTASNGDDTNGNGSTGNNPFVDRPPECAVLIEECHPKDDGTPGFINDCHVKLGHLGTQEECQTGIEEGCIETCDEAPEVDLGDLNCDETCGDLFACIQEAQDKCPGITDEADFFQGCLNGCAQFPPIDTNDCPATVEAGTCQRV